MFTKTSSELAPEEDQGAYLGIVNAPKYATADYTQAFSKQFTNAAEKIPEIDDTFLIVGIDGGGGGFFGFKLKEWSEREKKGAETKQEIQNLLNRECRRPGLRLRAAVAARRRRRPADPVCPAHDRRFLPGL